LAYDPATRMVTYDPTWGNLDNWARLYDDGPWTMGGHEPAGSVAGDHRWGITVFVVPPASGSQAYPYGLTDGSYEVRHGNGWMWPGPNGSFTVTAGATDTLTAPGLTLAPFGSADMRITIETTNLAGGPWDTSAIAIKGSAWGWGLISLTVDSDGKATFTLSDAVGPGKPFDHSGLLSTGD